MKRTLKRILFGFGGLIGLLLVVTLGAGLALNEPLPEGKEGPEAEALADKMLEAVDAKAWNKFKWISFEFPRGHSHIWDQKRNFAQVEWEGNRVLLDVGSRKGKAVKKGKLKEGEKSDELVEKAYHLFANDSFWLMAFRKIRDEGTQRKLVELESGDQALLVTYTSGGITPGDSYLWILDESGLPRAWKMWVEIIPVGGLEFSWEGWKDLGNGAMVAPIHKGDVFDIELKNVKVGKKYNEIGLEADPFTKLEKGF